MNALQQQPKRKLGVETTVAAGNVDTNTEQEGDSSDMTKLRRRGSSSDAEAITTSKQTEENQLIEKNESTGNQDDIKKGNDVEMTEKDTSSQRSGRGSANVHNITEDFNLLGSPRSTNSVNKKAIDFSGKKPMGLELLDDEYDLDDDFLGYSHSKDKKRKNRRTSWNPSFKNPGALMLDLVEVEKEACARAPATDSRSKQEAYKSVCSKVTDYLFIGGATAAQNKDELYNIGITHVINCSGNVTPNFFADMFTYYNLRLNDHNSEDISRYFYNVIDFIESARAQGGKVFVHCVKGISRSPAMVIVYIMWSKKMTFEEAYKFVKSARPVVNPNPGFIFQISEWSHARLAKTTVSTIFRVDKFDAQPNETAKLIKPLLVGTQLALTEESFRNPDKEISTSCYIASWGGELYVWCGRKASSNDRENAKEAASQLSQYELDSTEFMIVEAGDEPITFWNLFKHLPSQT